VGFRIVIFWGDLTWNNPLLAQSADESCSCKAWSKKWPVQDLN